MEYLWHGSPQKVDVLIPNQAHDIAFEEGCKLAVYATSKKEMAICFALGCETDSMGEAQRTMMPEFGMKMLFENCHPAYGNKGYLYKLDKSKFQYAYGSQWVCFDEVEPIEVEEIEVNDWLDLCIIN